MEMKLNITDNKEALVKLCYGGRCVATVTPAKNRDWTVLAKMVEYCLHGHPEEDKLLTEYLASLKQLKTEFRKSRRKDG